MLQRNAGSPSRGEGSRPKHLESQVSNAINAARALIGSTDMSPGEPGVAVGEQYLIFSLVDREFALQAMYIQGVERLAEVTPVPNVVSWVTGVINLRGAISSVVDLRAFLGVEELPFNPRTRLLSTKYNDMLICLVVDSVNEMVPIPPDAIDHTARNIPQWIASYAAGVAMVGNRRVILLDAARLLFTDKMHHYQV